MNISKSKIDKAGRFLGSFCGEYDEFALENELIFDEYRKLHLDPLTNFTLMVQYWLQASGVHYFIAQRLKRKPQIIRKLKRFSVRLTQLQDIGGCRIIVERNEDVDVLYQYLDNKIKQFGLGKISKVTDYRERGRDDSGYRALHVIVIVDGLFLELQLRSRIQHYWSESIERTSVIYGHRLKEQEGDYRVIDYFKCFSDALHDIELNKRLVSSKEIDLQQKRQVAESVINSFPGGMMLSGHVNQGVIQAMSQVEIQRPGQLNNWILVFDWTDGNFVTWEMVGRDVGSAIAAYLRYEAEFPEAEKKEVVMIGTSDVSTLQYTHSHYFGIDHHNAALEDMEKSIIGLSRRGKIDIGARRILLTMRKKAFWGSRKIAVATLRNHFCSGIASFDSSLEELMRRRIVVGDDSISLNVEKKSEIDSIV
ncbi:RelA/SpoT domain-containing protein [Pannonibacter sp. I15F10I1]|uniref:RelA/SpoT domain-containing protein n=1 Tax=Pannonibacter sp. I15F10I1 TaxID=2003580 RepID=UPI0016477E8B|nr:RelA/SpoT domain-containing protein [Pannonibacter sp. I15F10I1]